MKKLNRRTMLWLIAAIVIALASVVGVIYLLINIVRDVEIVSVKAGSNNTLSANIENVGKLSENINTLQTDANLLRLLANPKDTVFDVIKDALPDEEDAVALAARFQNNIFNGTGVIVEQVIVGGGDDKTGEIGINFTISGDFNQIITGQKRLENSIRPIIIKSVSISGDNAKYVASYTATTFYIPAIKFVIEWSEISGEKISVAKPILSEIIKPDDRIFGEHAINPSSWKQQKVGNGRSAN
jgi:hypothetical protein